MTSRGVVDEIDPSVELACVLVGMHHDEDLTFTGRLTAVAGWERMIAWASAMQGEQLLAIEQEADVARYGWHAADAARSLADELGLALGISGGSAARRLSTAATLIEKTPAVHDALRVGAITVQHARNAASAAAHVPVAVAQEAGVATMVSDDWRTPAQFADTFERHILDVDPEGAEQRQREAAGSRRVWRRNEPAGMGVFSALLLAEDCTAVYERVDASARSSLATNVDGDERTLDARRADALVQLVLGQISNGWTGCETAAVSGDHGDDGDPAERPVASSEPTRHGRKATVHVTVAWSTLFGLDDRPAHLAGYGAIDAATARRIAADPSSTWYRLLTDPTSGVLLDHGRTRYRPPQDLQDFVMARDRCCRFPGCERVAAACDLDHRTDWNHGGTTCVDCLDCLCRRHHLLRHQGGWTHWRDPDTGDSTWTDPHGGRHHRRATRLPTSEPVEPPAPRQPAPPAEPEPVLVDVGAPPF